MPSIAFKLNKLSNGIFSPESDKDINEAELEKVSFLKPTIQRTFEFQGLNNSESTQCEDISSIKMKQSIHDSCSSELKLASELNRNQLAANSWTKPISVNDHFSHGGWNPEETLINEKSEISFSGSTQVVSSGSQQKLCSTNSLEKEQIFSSKLAKNESFFNNSLVNFFFQF